jgi:hypothetical protein
MKYTQLAKLVPVCMGCRKIADGTIVCAHRNHNSWGIRSGRGIKNIDLLSAFLCAECHVYGDGPGQRDYQWWEWAVHRSITWAYEEGYISVRA